MNIRIVKVKPSVNVITFIALNDKSEFVGQVNISVLMNNRLKLTGAFVDENYRKRGVYSKLFEARMLYIHKHFPGYEMQAYCNPQSVKMFQDNGFEPSEIIQKMTKKVPSTVDSR